MNGQQFEHLLASLDVLRHPCDLDVLLFLYRHPRALLTRERLAAYVGYDLDQVVRSLDHLANAGLVQRVLNPTHAVRLYILKTPDTWHRRFSEFVGAFMDTLNEKYGSARRPAFEEAYPEK